MTSDDGDGLIHEVFVHPVSHVYFVLEFWSFVLGFCFAGGLPLPLVA